MNTLIRNATLAFEHKEKCFEDLKIVIHFFLSLGPSLSDNLSSYYTPPFPAHTISLQTQTTKIRTVPASFGRRPEIL